MLIFVLTFSGYKVEVLLFLLFSVSTVDLLLNVYCSYYYLHFVLAKALYLDKNDCTMYMKFMNSIRRCA